MYAPSNGNNRHVDSNTNLFFCAIKKKQIAGKPDSRYAAGVRAALQSLSSNRMCLGFFLTNIKLFQTIFGLFSCDLYDINCS